MQQRTSTATRKPKAQADAKDSRNGVRQWGVHDHFGKHGRRNDKGQRSDLIYRARRRRGNWRGLHSATFEFWRIALNLGCNLNGKPLALVLSLQHAATVTRN